MIANLEGDRTGPARAPTTAIHPCGAPPEPFSGEAVDQLRPLVILPLNSRQ